MVLKLERPKKEAIASAPLTRITDFPKLGVNMEKDLLASNDFFIDTSSFFGQGQQRI